MRTLKTITKGLFVVLFAFWATPCFAAEPPSLEGQIDVLAHDNGNRSVVIRVRHPRAMDQPSDLVSARVVRQLAYVRASDTGTISVQTHDYKGNVIDTWLAMDPLLDHSSADENGAVARYALPYSKVLASVTLENVVTGWKAGFKLRDVVGTFCVANPTDVACEKSDLFVDVISPVGTPLVELKVGASTTIRLNVIAKNLAEDTSGGRLLIAPISASPKVSFNTSDQVDYRFDRIPSGFNFEKTIEYQLTCLEPGDERIFPGAMFRPASLGSIVEVNEGNNKSNQIFDVKCVPE
jgi:hypothetical protein